MKLFYRDHYNEIVKITQQLLDVKKTKKDAKNIKNDKSYAKMVYQLYLRYINANDNKNPMDKHPDLDVALQLRNIVHADGYDYDVLENEKQFFSNFQKQIGETLSKALDNDPKYFSSKGRNDFIARMSQLLM